MSDTEEDHYYATGYDVDSDPYVYENGVFLDGRKVPIRYGNRCVILT